MTKYEVLIDGVSVWTSRNGYEQTAINPTLTLKFNKTDELRITLLPDNPAFDTVGRFRSTVDVTENDVTIFRGRVRAISTTLKGNKTITCEGPFAYFIDSYWTPANRLEIVHRYFERLVENHNSQIGDGRTFVIGECTNETKDVKDLFYLEDFETSQAILTEFLNRQRAFIEFVYGSDITVNLRPGMEANLASQVIEFGENLIDITNDDSDEVFSSIMPIGDNNIMLTPPVIDIPDAKAAYGGRILSIQRFSVSTQTDLRKIANKFIEAHQSIFPSTFTVTALDMSILDYPVDKLKVGMTYRLHHSRIGVDVERVLTQADLNLARPSQSSYTFEDVNAIWNVADIGQSPGGYGWNGRYADINSAGSDDEGKAKDGSAKKSTKKDKSSSGGAAESEHGLYVMYDKQRNLEISARKLNVKFDNLDAYAKATDGRVTEVKANVDGLSTTVTGIDGKVGQLQVQADRIELSVGDKADKKAIIELINSGEGGQVKIRADRIELDGQTIVDALEGQDVYAQNFNADGMYVEFFDSNVGQASVFFGEDLGCATLNGETCNVCTFYVGDTSVGSFFGPGDISINLSDLPGYDDAIKAARIEGANSVNLSSAGWINGVNTVTARSPYTADKTFPVNLPPISISGGDTWSSAHKTTVTVSTPSVSVPIAQKEINATPVHNAAWRDALDTVRLDPSSTTKMEFGKDIEVKAIGSDVAGFSETLATVTIQAPDPGDAYEQGAKDLWDSLNYSSASWSDGPQPAPGWQNTTITITTKYGSKQWQHQVRIP